MEWNPAKHVQKHPRRPGTFLEHVDPRQQLEGLGPFTLGLERLVRKMLRCAGLAQFEHQFGLRAAGSQAPRQTRQQYEVRGKGKGKQVI